MKKFIVGVLTISGFSILYVLQQTKLLEYSYAINSNQRYMSLLVDRNKQLRYNIAKLEIPTRLEDIMLAKRDAGVCRLKRWYKIRVKKEGAEPSQRVAALHDPFIRTGRVLFKMFLLDAEAVAKEQNREE